MTKARYQNGPNQAMAQSVSKLGLTGAFAAADFLNWILFLSQLSR